MGNCRLGRVKYSIRASDKGGLLHSSLKQKQIHIFQYFDSSSPASSGINIALYLFIRFL